MIRNLLTLAMLGVCWMAWSGHYTSPDHPLLIGFAILSLGITIWISHRMDIFDDESHPMYLAPPRLALYLPWLVVEVLKSNIDVVKRILGPSDAVTPTMVRVRSTQRSAVGQVIFANSITLTPGTVSIEVQRGEILVHALSREGAAELAGGEMDRRVSETEHIP